jgi:hypothetical protein
MPKLLAAILMFALFSCSTPKDFTGRFYRNNFAEMGFFGTRLRFTSADSLQYAFSGDMLYDSTVGSYKIFKNKLFILFRKVDLDTTVLTGSSNRFNYQIKYDTVGIEIITYQYFFYIGNDKLYFSNWETGKKVTKAHQYNDQRRYIVFGPHNYKKRHYMKRLK